MLGKIGQNNTVNSSQYIQDVRETGQLGGRVVKVSTRRFIQEEQSEIDAKTTSDVYLSMRGLANDVDEFFKLLSISSYPERLHKYIKCDGDTPYIKIGIVNARVFEHPNQLLILWG
ncbi:hypothetical protein AACJ45_002951 [Escherichia coli]|nr:hypothetical protein [Escherichia coli]EGI4106095.1 hypothetical protein [Escherichia coli]